LECVGAIICQTRRRATSGGTLVSLVKECREAAGLIAGDGAAPG